MHKFLALNYFGSLNLKHCSNLSIVKAIRLALVCSLETKVVQPLQGKFLSCLSLHDGLDHKVFRNFERLNKCTVMEGEGSGHLQQVQQTRDKILILRNMGV